jgi:6-pyruvoyltetrahydropterin/6-carboxytetrahydropterin synthase
MNTNQFIRVTKSFTFDMAHALYGYDGPCKNIHGHTYTLYITLKGKVINDLNNPKNGMVIDFTDFKTIVKSTIIDVFDHSLVLNSLSPHYNLTELKATFEKIIFLPFQPSCENLVLNFLNSLKNKFPNKISIVSIKLYETPTSYAEWFEEDN